MGRGPFVSFLMIVTRKNILFSPIEYDRNIILGMDEQVREKVGKTENQ